MNECIAMAPILTQAKCDQSNNTCQSISDDCFMAVSLNYRGADLQSKEANATVQWLKNNNNVSFVEWCPTGFKIRINDVPAVLPEDDVGVSPNNVTMIGNNTGISRVFTERIIRKYDLMYSQRAFVHWCVYIEYTVLCIDPMSVQVCR